MAPHYHGLVLTVPEKKDRRRIVVRNKSGSLSAYYLIHAGPEHAEMKPGSRGAEIGNNALGSPLHCVYQASELIPSGMGQFAFHVEDGFYGVCGSGQGTVSVGRFLHANDARNVELSTKSGEGTILTMSMLPGREAAFDDDQAGTRDKMTVLALDSFGIRVTTTFSIPNPKHPFIGFGSLHPVDADIVAPLMVWKAEPGAFYSITCAQRWKIVLGLRPSGVVIGTNELSTTALVDFEGEGKNSKIAIVTHNSNGEFEVKYQ